MPGCASVCRYAPNDYAPSRIWVQAGCKVCLYQFASEGGAGHVRASINSAATHEILALSRFLCYNETH